MEEEKIKLGEKIKDYYERVCGKWNEKSLEDYFVSFIKSESALSEKLLPDEIVSIAKNIVAEIDKLKQIQNLSDEDVDYLGLGQSFLGIGVGNAVLKIQNYIGSKRKVLEIPYRLNPKYQTTLYETKDGKNVIDMYVSDRAITSGIKEDDVQKMYNIIRENGGIWLDVKDDNLGTLGNDTIDFKKYYKSIDNFKVSKKFPKYNDNLYIIDYEDVVFLDKKLIKEAKKDGRYTGWGRFGNGVPYMPDIKIDALDEKSLDDIYFEGYIKNSSTLLEYEKRYQAERGNEKIVNKCEKELANKIKEREKRKRLYEENKNKRENLFKYELEQDVEELDEISRIDACELESSEKIKNRNFKEKDLEDYDIYQTESADSNPYQTAPADFDPYKTR